MRNRAVVWLGTGAALLLSCTATRLATLQGDFNDLYEAKRACDEPGGDAPLCLGAQEVALYELATEAEKAAGQAKDARTKITLLRLAGVAAWQGAGQHADALVTKVSLEGVKACDTLEARVRQKETWGAPRDCTMLVLLPALLAHETQLEKLASLRAAKSCTAGDVELRKIADSYADSTVLFVDTHEAKALGYQGTSESVRAYVAETKRRMQCGFHTEVIDVASDFCREQIDRLLDEKDRIEQATGATFLDAC